MEQVFEASKRIELKFAPSFIQTFRVMRVGRFLFVYVEGRAVSRYSVEGKGYYTPEGIRKVAKHYGFNIPANVEF